MKSFSIYFACLMLLYVFGIGLVGCESETALQPISASEPATKANVVTLGNLEQVPDDAWVITMYVGEQVIEVNDQELVARYMDLAEGYLKSGDDGLMYTDDLDFNLAMRDEIFFSGYIGPVTMFYEPECEMTWGMIKWCVTHPNDPRCKDLNKPD